jgi:hypothetical protein
MPTAILKSQSRHVPEELLKYTVTGKNVNEFRRNFTGRQCSHVFRRHDEFALHGLCAFRQIFHSLTTKTGSLRDSVRSICGFAGEQNGPN